MSRCQDCSFSRRTVQLGAPPALYCHVNPPQIHITPVAPQQGGGMFMSGIWPPIQGDDWCGKFEHDRMLS